MRYDSDFCFVQVNIYGATLNELHNKGVDIPKLLSGLGFNDTTLLEVPISDTYMRKFQNGSREISLKTRWNSEHFSRVKSEQSSFSEGSKNLRDALVSLNNIRTSSSQEEQTHLLNCSLSTIQSYTSNGKRSGTTSNASFCMEDEACEDVAMVKSPEISKCKLEGSRSFIFSSSVVGDTTVVAEHDITFPVEKCMAAVGLSVPFKDPNQSIVFNDCDSNQLQSRTISEPPVNHVVPDSPEPCEAAVFDNFLQNQDNDESFYDCVGATSPIYNNDDIEISQRCCTMNIEENAVPAVHTSLQRRVPGLARCKSLHSFPDKVSPLNTRRNSCSAIEDLYKIPTMSLSEWCDILDSPVSLNSGRTPFVLLENSCASDVGNIDFSYDCPAPLEQSLDMCRLRYVTDTCGFAHVETEQSVGQQIAGQLVAAHNSNLTFSPMETTIGDNKMEQCQLNLNTDTHRQLSIVVRECVSIPVHSPNIDGCTNSYLEEKIENAYPMLSDTSSSNCAVPAQRKKRGVRSISKKKSVPESIDKRSQSEAFGVGCDDIRVGDSTRLSEKEITDDEVEDTMVSPRKKPRRSTAEVGFNLKSDINVFKCQAELCQTTISWRPRYGKNRLMDHVRIHANFDSKKCVYCDFTAKFPRAVRVHHEKYHADQVFKPPINLETADNLKELLNLWKKCFPDIDAPSLYCPGCVVCSKRDGYICKIEVPDISLSRNHCLLPS